MNKNFLLILLTIVCSILAISLVQMSNRASFHYKEAYYASKVIEQIILDNEDYYYDVLVETDAWQNYINL